MSDVMRRLLPSALYLCLVYTVLFYMLYFLPVLAIFSLLWFCKLRMEGERTEETCHYWAGHGTFFLGAGYLLTYDVRSGRWTKAGAGHREGHASDRWLPTSLHRRTDASNPGACLLSSKLNFVSVLSCTCGAVGDTKRKTRWFVCRQGQATTAQVGRNQGQGPRANTFASENND
jgi:hypothetical protein